MWNRAANEVIFKHLPIALAEGKSPAPVDQPAVHFTSTAVGSDVTFTVTYHVFPEVTLPNLSEIKVEPPKEATPATDEEVEAVLLDLRRAKFKRAHPEKEPPEAIAELPELDDEFLKEISPGTAGLDAFKGMVRENITKEKDMQMKHGHRGAILEAVLNATKVTVPPTVIEAEAKHGIEEIRKHAETLGTTVEEFLKKSNMTEEQLLADMRKDAERRAKTQIILSTIASEQNLRPDPEMVDKEIARYSGKKHGMSEEQLRMYINSILTNERAVRWLEEQFK